MKAQTKSILFALFLLGVFGLSHGCAASGREGVAIYLTRDDISPSHMEMYSHVELAEQPVIGPGDIVTYNAQTFELKLTPEAFERLAQLKVPTTGKSFLVCIGRSPVYWGAFWTPMSSQSFDGVTIWQPNNVTNPPIVTLELGYPASSFYSGEDPRNKVEILDTLRKAGKLVNALELADVDRLPRSFKGYEIYSQQDNGSWQFTLITGTNRNKTLEEILSGEDFISETGWILLHCRGEEELKTALAKIPTDDWVSLLDGAFLSGDSPFSLPPPEIAERIKAFARERGLHIN